MADVTCPECGTSYANVAMHWSRGSCDPPEFSDRQRSILTGVLLVGGRITDPPEKKNPHFEVTSSNKPLLDWMHSELGVLARDDVAQVATADEAQATIQGMHPEVDVSNRDFSNLYRLETRSLDRLHEWRRDWYAGDERTVPSTVSLDSVSRKVAYAMNGRIETREDGRQTAVIGVTRGNATTPQLRTFFDGFAPRVTHSDTASKLYLFNSQAFFDHIGWDALPGCERRWPEERSLDEPDTTCPTCAGRYDQLGSHWAKSTSCKPTELSDEQYAVILGLLVSGAIVRVTSEATQPLLKIQSTNKRALDYAAEKLGWLTASLSVTTNAEDASSELSEFIGDAVSASDLYVLRTWAHQSLREFYDPTDGVGRQLPDSIPSRAETLRVLHDFHGYRVNRGSARRLIFNANNTTVSQEQLLELLSQFDAHTESSSRPVVVVKDVAGFSSYISDTYADALETVFSP